MECTSVESRSTVLRAVQYIQLSERATSAALNMQRDWFMKESLAAYGATDQSWEPSCGQSVVTGGRSFGAVAPTVYRNSEPRILASANS